jgi:hypothetical protein
MTKQKRTVQYPDGEDSYRFTYHYNHTSSGYQITPMGDLANPFFVFELDKADDILTCIHKSKRHLKESAQNIR